MTYHTVSHKYVQLIAVNFLNIYNKKSGDKAKWPYRSGRLRITLVSLQKLCKQKENGRKHLLWKQ